MNDLPQITFDPGDVITICVDSFETNRHPRQVLTKADGKSYVLHQRWDKETKTWIDGNPFD